MKRCVQLVLIAYLVGAVSAKAVLVQSATWGTTGTSDTNVAGNWVGSALPGSGSNLVFDASTQTNVVFGASFSAGQISFTNSFPAYVFSTSNGSILSVGGGITMNSGGATTVTFNSSLPIALTANQTWLADSAATLVVNGVVSGAFNLTKSGGGTLVLGGTNTYAGTTTISSGYVSIADDRGLGAVPASATPGALVLNGGSLATSATMTLNANRGIDVGATGGAFDVANGTTLTYGGIMTGSGALALNPTGGTLVLTGANTYGGTLTNFGSILSIGNGGTSGSFAGNIANGGALGFNRSDNSTYAGVISGGGTVAKQGAGKLTLTGANTGTGAITVNNGTLELGTGGSLDLTSGLNLRPTSGATAGFSLAAGQAQTVGGIYFDGTDSTSASNITLGTGTLTLGADVTYDAINNPGAATISGGTLALGATRNFSIGNSSSTTAELSVSSVISGAGFGLNKSGSGTLVLSGANTYTGSTTINGGTVSIATIANGGVASPLGASTNVASSLVLNGGTLLYTGPAASTDRSFTIGTSENASTIAASGTGALTFTDPNSIAFQTANVSTTLTLTGTSVAANTLTPTWNDNNLGHNSLVKSGTGTWVLAGANTYTGGTTVTAGTLTDGKANAFSSGSAMTISSGATLSIAFNETIKGLNDFSGAGGTVTIQNAGTALTVTGGGSNFSGTIGGAGGLTLSGGALLTLTGANTYSGGTIINDNNPSHLVDVPQSGLVIGNGGTSGSITGAITNNGFVTFNRSDASLFAGNISGTGSVNVQGGGTVTLSGANTYSGSTQLTFGTLVDGAAGAFSPNGAIFFQGGAGTALNVNFNETVKGLGGLSAGNGSTISLGNNVTLTISPSGLTYAGAITGATGALVLSGSGTQALTGANTYGGGTTIGSGTILQIGASGINSGTTGSIAGNVTNNGTLIFARTDDLAFGGVISGSGNVVQNGFGTLTLTGANSYGGATTISSGTVKIGQGGTTGAISGSVALNGGTLEFNRSDTVTFGSLISGSGTLTQDGPGTLILTGSNIFSGLTRITGGTLQLGTGGTTGSINGNVQDDGTLVFNRSDSVFFNGTISGSGGLVKQGTGTLTLTGTSSNFDGPVVIQNGTVSVNSIQPQDYYSALGAGNGTSAIAIGSGATSATLRYTGSGNSTTDRPIDLAGTTGGATLDMSSLGSVNFQGGVTASGAGSKTLTLTGNSFSSVSAISGAIADNSVTNKTSILKTGVGIWQLSGANTFTGGVTITNGTLRLGGGNTLGSNNVVVNASGGGFNATLDVAGTNQTIGALTLGGAGGLVSNNVVLGYSGALTLGGNVTYDATNNPLGSVIGRASLTDFTYPYGGVLNLGGTTRTIAVGDSNSSSMDLTILANIYDATAGITKTGAGTLVLGGESTYAGGTVVSTGSGALLLAGSSTLDENGTTVHDGPLGAGTLTLQAGTTLAPTQLFGTWGSFTSDVRLHNAISFADNVTLGLGDSGQRLTLAGTVTAAAATSTLHLANLDPVEFSGTLTAATAGSALKIDSGAVSERTFGIVSGSLGANLATLTIDHAGMIFGTPTSLANSTAIKVINGGYVGLGYNGGTAPTAAALLARIAAPDRTAFAGTFGFDTRESYYYPYLFADTLDFSGFGSGLTIGSATSAILTGAITPPSGGYTFGNGGGTLVVRSNLADVGGLTSASVISSSTIPHSALRLIFQGNNSYTGNLSVTRSVAILDSPTALPTGSFANLTGNGYLGYTEAFTPAATFAGLLSRIGGYTGSSILGFDSHDYIASETTSLEGYGYQRVVTEPLNLSAFNPIYLGTATNAVIAGRVVAPTGGTLALAAIGEGYLRVETALRSPDVTSVAVGPVGTVFDAGTVALVGRNTYSGGTTLFNGSLYLEGDSKRSASGAIQFSPIGTGTFTVANTATKALLFTDSENEMVLHNLVSLGARLQIGQSSFFEGGGDAEWYPSFSNLTLNGVVSDVGGSVGGLDVYAGVTLNAANTFTGGVTLHEGSLALGSDTALGTGTLTIESTGYDDVALRTTGGTRTLANAVVVNAFNDSALEFGGRGAFVLNGPLTLNGTAYLELGNYPVTINGNIGSTGFGGLTVEGYSALVINGTANTYNGGTFVDYGAVIFGSATSIPASPTAGLSSNYSGYIGVASPTFATSLQTDFLNRFNKPSTSGSIGFDTPAGSSTNTFSGAISLAGFNSNARLGSATSAILTGTITPQNFSGYQFGGGGGRLEVNSGLTNNGETLRSVYVFSTPYDPLTLRLGGTNSYSGGTQVSNSGVIFQVGAQPSSGNVYLYGGGYAGTEAAAGTVEATTFLSSITSGSSGNPIIGFDSFSGTYSANQPITWPTIDGNTPFFGTATSANLSGAFTLASGSTYRFAGYKGGQLTVSTPLADVGKPMSVQIGDASNAATYRAPTDPTSALSTVTLSGNNTYSGGTTLAAGRLLIGASTALGSGPLTVSSGGYGELDLPPATLGATTNLTLANNIALGSTLNLAGGASFTLSGVISDYGEFSPGYAPQLYKTGSNTVTLSGNNTFTGGIYIAQGVVVFNSANAMGTGPLLLGGPLGPTATFGVSTTLNGVSGDNSTDLINLGAGTTLTINQQNDAQYLGTFSSTGASLVYKGPTPSTPAALRLLGASSYNGGTQIQGGIAVIAANDNAFGSSSVANNVVTLNGGRLFVDSGVTLSNSLVLTSGLLGGVGTVQPPATLHVAGAAGNVVILGPGFGDNPGTLQFSNANAALGSSAVLSLEGGGMYRWQLADATNASGGFDKINVTGTVNITASAVTPFNFKIVPVTSVSLASLVANFDSSLSYSWNVLTATSITGFNATAFSVDASALGSSIGIGSFNFTLNGGNTLTLNFSPVPEPSTYVLFASGLGFLAFAVRRRRSARR